MAKIVLGAGCSHTPLLTLAPEEWTHRSAADHQNPRLNLSDGRFVSYPELLAEVGAKYDHLISDEELERKARICQAALDRLADELESADPDIVIIVGDDQRELFTATNQPLIAIFHGDAVVTNNKFGADSAPDWVRTMGRGYMMDEVRRAPGAPGFALEIIRGLLDRHVDIASAAKVENPTEAGFGHAYGFIIQRLFKGREIPVVPVLLNTYYPPNVPSSSRCLEIGQALKGAIEAIPGDTKVAVIASGGLSHFVVDEALDSRVIACLNEIERLRDIPRAALNSGSSEILNWILTAGAVEHLKLSWCEYQPIYRTSAGTGIGVAFAAWHPQNIIEEGNDG